MQASTINGATFKFFKQGSTTKVGASVGYDVTTDKATLDPTNPLKRGATYKAVVTTEAKDLLGSRLDQNPSVSGLQQKVWNFRVKYWATAEASQRPSPQGGRGATLRPISLPPTLARIIHERLQELRKVRTISLAPDGLRPDVDGSS